MPSAKLGLNAKAYYNTGTHASPVWVEIPEIMDLKINFETADADVSYRGSGGFEAKVPVLSTLEADGGMLYLPGETAYDFLEAAAIAKTSHEFAFCDADITTVGTRYWNFTAFVGNFSEGQELKEGQKVDFKATNTPGEFTPLKVTVAA